MKCLESMKILLKLLLVDIKSHLGHKSITELYVLRFRLKHIWFTKDFN